MKSRVMILLGLIGLSIAQAAYYYEKLPNPMVSHWDWAGEADAWLSPPEFFLIFFLIDLLCLGWLLVIPFLPRVPDRFLNLPNRDYWLAPERRDETYAKLGCDLMTVGIATQLVMLAVLQLAIGANLREPPDLSGGIFYLLIAYFAFVFYWCFAFQRKFRRRS